MVFLQIAVDLYVFDSAPTDIERHGDTDGICTVP